MTVAEMSPLQLYAVIITANVICFLVLLGLREWRNLKNKREKFVMFVGLAGVVGLPVVMGLMLIRP